MEDFLLSNQQACRNFHSDIQRETITDRAYSSILAKCGHTDIRFFRDLSTNPLYFQLSYMRVCFHAGVRMCSCASVCVSVRVVVYGCLIVCV